MLDIQLLRSQPAEVAARLASRGAGFDVAAFQALEEERKGLQVRTQDLQAKRNALSKQIGQLKAKGEDTATVMQEVAGLGDELKRNEETLADLLNRINAFVSVIPNLPHESVPAGKSEADNVEVRRWGTPRDFGFAVKDHVDLGEALGGIDFDAATKISGARFTLMKGAVARLHRVLQAIPDELAIRQPGEIVMIGMEADLLLGDEQAVTHLAERARQITDLVIGGHIQFDTEIALAHLTGGIAQRLDRTDEHRIHEPVIDRHHQNQRQQGDASHDLSQIPCRGMEFRIRIGGDQP
mgnify:CR=1 FL=1